MQKFGALGSCPVNSKALPGCIEQYYLRFGFPPAYLAREPGAEFLKAYQAILDEIDYGGLRDGAQYQLNDLLEPCLQGRTTLEEGLAEAEKDLQRYASE